MKTTILVVLVLLVTLLGCNNKPVAKEACATISGDTCLDWSDSDSQPKWQRGSTALFVGGESVPSGKAMTIYEVQCATFDSDSGVKGAMRNMEDITSYTAYKNGRTVCAVCRANNAAPRRANKWAE